MTSWLRALAGPAMHEAAASANALARRVALMVVGAVAFAVASAWFFVRSLRREGRGGWMTVLHGLRFVIALAVAFTLLRPERVIINALFLAERLDVLCDG